MLHVQVSQVQVIVFILGLEVRDYVRVYLLVQLELLLNQAHPLPTEALVSDLKLQ